LATDASVRHVIEKRQAAQVPVAEYNVVKTFRRIEPTTKLHGVCQFEALHH
jgi:hypothetical protein